MRIVNAGDERRDEIISLLQSQNLPTSDLPASLSGFYIALEDDKIIGVIGMERYGQYGLLRSMVVQPDYRNKQVAKTLVDNLEQAAASAGIVSIYLLTETAAKYFEEKGYKTIERKEVPAPVTTSTEFSHVCPVSAIVMKKALIQK